MWLYKEGSKLEIEANEVEWYNLFLSLNSICFQLILLKYAHGTQTRTRVHQNGDSTPTQKCGYNLLSQGPALH